MSGITGKVWWERIGYWLYSLWFVLVLVTVLCIPFHKVFPVFPLILSAMAGLLALVFSKPFKNAWNRPLLLLSVCLYLIPVYAWFISADRETAVLDMQVKFSLWVIPLIFALNKPLSGTQFNILWKAIVLSCASFIAVALSIAGWEWLVHADNYFNYKKLVSFTIIHPSYVGMYINLSMAFLLYDLLKQPKEMQWLSPVVVGLMIVVMFIFLVLLTSKNAVILGMAMLIFAAWQYARTSGNLKRAIGFSAAVLLLFSLFVVLNPTTRERFTMLYRFNQVSYDNSVNSREETWNAATQLIAEQGVFGTGSGDAQADLNTIYAKNGFALGVKENHNAHNQYLQIVIESGLPGFIIFLLIIGICLANAWRQPDKKYLLFLIIFLFSMLTEAMLETQSGVVFFVIFNCIFLSAERPRQN